MNVGLCVRRLMRCPAVAVLLVCGAWGALYGRQVAAGFSNVDDYLYSSQTRAYLAGFQGGPHGLVRAWESFGINSPLVPMLSLPVAAIADDPMFLVVVQLPVLLTMFAGLVALARGLGVSAVGSWWVAVGVAVLPGVLGYAVMVHFAVASTACVVWLLAAYMRSDRLRSKSWSVVVGLAAGLLTISRVVAVVYAAVLGLVLAYDFLVEHADRAQRAGGAALALTVAALVAAPWWLTAGPSAIRYLVGAGYGDNSGFAPRSSALRTVTSRLTWTATETGWLLAIILLVTFVVVVVVAVRRRDRPALLVAAVATASMGGLATSSNAGTAFALPVTVLMALLVLTWSARQARQLRLVAGVVVGLSLFALLLPVNSQASKGPTLWQSGSPGLNEVRDALGRPIPEGLDAEQLARDVAHVAGSRTLLVVRDDAVLNANIFGWVLPGLPLRTPGYGAHALSKADLKGAAVLTGMTSKPYHQGLSPIETEQLLVAQGYRRVFLRTFSPSNDIEVWIPR